MFAVLYEFTIKIFSPYYELSTMIYTHKTNIQFFFTVSQIKGYSNILVNSVIS